MTFTISETTMLRGVDNQITLVISKAVNSKGLTLNNGTLNLEMKIMKQLIVTVSGLTGTEEPSDDAFKLDSCEGPSAWGAHCLVGLVPLKGTKTWRTGVAEWDQDAGTLKFTVIGKITDTGKVGDVEGDKPLTIKFTLANAHVAQPKVTTSIESCTGTNKWTTCSSSASCQKVCKVHLSRPGVFSIKRCCCGMNR
jgi:hypothetical protein